MKNIIKNGTYGLATATARQNLIKNRVAESNETARRIITESEEQAAAIVSAARHEAENLRVEAYDAGAEKAVVEFAEIIAAAYLKRDAAVREVEQDVLKLSIKLAEKIIGRELEGDRKTIADIVATALKNVRQQERLTVRVNPQDLPAIEEFKTNFAHAARTAFLDFEPDPKIASGGCIIESEVGTVDARLETQLKILERALLRQAEAE